MKALLFDACDILYHRPQYEQKLDSFFGPERKFLHDKNQKKLLALQFRAAKGSISLNEMFDGMLSLYGLPLNRYEEGRRFMVDLMADVEFFDGVCPSLHQLKTNGFKLAIVTNSFQSPKTKLDWLSKAGIDQVWDAFVSSSETGTFKPEPEIYLATLEQLGYEPAEAAFVAHAANELDGAKAVGLTTIAFNRDDSSVQADYILEHFSELVGLANELRAKTQAGL